MPVNAYLWDLSLRTDSVSRGEADRQRRHLYLLRTTIMFWVLLILILILSVVLIGMVLLQPSKGGGITAAFGGVGGSLGATFGQRRTLEALGKGTTYTAIAIAVLCIITNIFFVPRSQSGAGTGVVTEGSGAPVQSTTTAPGGGLNVGGTPSGAPATGQSAEGGAAAEQQPAGGEGADGAAEQETPAAPQGGGN